MPTASPVPRKNNLTKWQKRSTLIIICTISLLGGVEYAVILPTLYEHLQQTYNAPNYFLGMVLAGFSFSGLFASPVMGRFYDKTRRSKLIISLTNIFECAGSIMYWLGISPWFLLASRLVAGLGNGFFPVVLAEISHGTTNKERTSVVSAIMAMRQFGLLVGPALNLFLAKTNFYIGPFIVDKFSSPGLMMALIWFIAQVLLMVMYNPLTTISQEDTPTETNSSVQSENSINNSQSDSEHMSQTTQNGVSQTTHNGVSQTTHNGVSQTTQNGVSPVANGSASYQTDAEANGAHQLLRSDNELQANNSESSVPETTYMLSYKDFVKEILYEEYIAICMLTMVALFNQTGMETLVTPIAYNYMGWTENEVSLMYFGAGVDVLMSFLLVGLFSRRYQDRTLIIFGLLCQVFSLAWFFAWVPYFRPIKVGLFSKRYQDRTLIIFGLLCQVVPLGWLFAWVPYFKPIKEDYSRNMMIFIPGFVINVFGLPFLFVSHIALFSKLLPSNIQGFGHGIRRTIAGMASILGPLWTGSLLDNWFLMLGVMLGLNMLALLLLILSFKKLNIPVNAGDTDSSPAPANTDQPNEKTPLLINA